MIWIQDRKASSCTIQRKWTSPRSDYYGPRSIGKKYFHIIQEQKRHPSLQGRISARNIKSRWKKDQFKWKLEDMTGNIIRVDGPDKSICWYPRGIINILGHGIFRIFYQLLLSHNVIRILRTGGNGRYYFLPVKDRRKYHLFSPGHKNYSKEKLL